MTPEVPVPWSELHQLRSGSGVQFDLYVALPPEYHPGSGVSYPVLYVLDAFLFDLMVPTVRLLNGGGFPEMILVCVDRPFDTRVDQAVNRRFHLTPTSIPAYEQDQSERFGQEVRTGGADAFLEMLTGEIIPWVEQRYSVSADRGLAGVSLGGLFATHVLFTSPESFTHYLIGSPALSWDGGVMFDRESAYAAESHDLPVHVFMSSGTGEGDLMISNMVARMVETLSGREYPNLSLETHIFQDEGHFSVIPAAMSRGLRALFGRR
jgi:predicted alpha/beta superfamily hydrolase